jgi:mannose-6-phosphate isomerase-like protein (cupin superfamily)
MNNRIDKFSRRALLGTILVIASVRLFAENSSTEFSKYDAVAAAPGNHQLVLENEKVRILEVTIKPGEKEPFHVHSMPSVMIIVSGSKLRITQATIADGEVVTGKSIEVGADNFQPPPLWMPPQGIHSAENTGSTNFRAYRIELKSGETLLLSTTQ